MLLDPWGGAQLIDLGPLQAARAAIIQVLEAGTDFKLRILQPNGQAAVLLPQPLPFD